MHGGKNALPFSGISDILLFLFGKKENYKMPYFCF